MIAGFRREVVENCAVLGHYADSSGNLLQTFRDNLSVPSLGFKTTYRFHFQGSCPCENGTYSFFPENSVKNYQHSLPNNPEKRSFYPDDCDGDQHVLVLSGYVMNTFYRRTFVGRIV